MKKPAISDIIAGTERYPARADKVALLRQFDCHPLRAILFYAFDPSVEWLLPEGDVPYRPSDFGDSEGMLYSEARKIYLFVKGGNPNLRQMKREMLYVHFLESLYPKDAELMVYVKDKKLPAPGLTADIVREAFPGLLSNGQDTQALQLIEQPVVELGGGRPDPEPTPAPKKATRVRAKAKPKASKKGAKNKGRKLPKS